MKRKMVPLFILLLLVFGCANSNKSQRQTLEGLNVARDIYNQTQNTLKALHDSGMISTEVWNSKVVPADNAANIALQTGYVALKAWVASGSQENYAAYAEAITQAFKFILTMRNLVETYGPQPGGGSQQ